MGHVYQILCFKTFYVAKSCHDGKIAYLNNVNYYKRHLKPFAEATHSNQNDLKIRIHFYKKMSTKRRD
jgi:hypothetical protein